MPVDIVLVRLETLKEHEEVDECELQRVIDKLRREGVVRKPIVVDKRTNIILDGHVRFNALRRLGCVRVPVVFVDYSSNSIEVSSWKPGRTLTKDIIIRSAQSGALLPPKTSKHLIQIGGWMKHISAVEKRVDVPIEELFRE